MAQDFFEQLHAAVKQAESQGKRFDEKGNLLTSPKGAQGEMQVMPKTQRDPGYGVVPAKGNSPDEIARVGKDYLQAMLNKYGDTKTALMAYNWGPGNTDTWLASGADPKKVPAETQKYTSDILNSLGGAKASTKRVAEAQDLVKDAGPGYKAAMAMMFLADDKPKTDDEDIWKEAEPEQTAAADVEEPASPLASLELSYKSPFPAQKVQPVAHLAAGGLPGAPKVGVKGTAREELDKVKADYDRYTKEADTYNAALNQYKTDIYDPYTTEVTKYNTGLEDYKTNTYNPYVKAVGDYNASLDKYKQELYNPYLSAVEKYNTDLADYKTNTYDPYISAVDKYNAALKEYETNVYNPYSKALDEYNTAAEAWNAGPRTTAFDKTAPTLASTFDMAAPTAPAAFAGTVPTAPEAFSGTAPATPEAFSMAVPTLSKTFDQTAPVAPTVTQADYDKMVAASRQDVVNRQHALDVASNPEAYGLTINKLFARGGVVHRADGSPEEGEMLQETYLDPGMKTEYSNAPKRSAKAMLAYMQSMNPSVMINKTPMDSNTMGYVSSRMPDIVNLNPEQSPAREELTKLHELEHSMALRSGDILGRPNVSSQDNAYRAYYLMGKDWGPIRQFAHNMASNREKLEKFFGQPMDSGYLNVDPETLDKIRNRGDALQGLAEEQMASLSALEQSTGKFLTQDPEMRKLFPSTKMMAVYDALTGPRQTRMDARDLPPHTPVPSYMYQDNPVLRFIQKHTTGKDEYGIPIKRADGSPETGEVKEPWLPAVSDYAASTAYEMYPGQQGQFDQQDAARHMLAAGTLARKYGPETAEFLGKAHEITTSPFRYIGSKLGISEMPVDYEQDLHNNKIGIELAARSKSQKDLEDLVMQMAEQHRLQKTAGKPWTGKPVRRGDGSPETGEIGPAFGNPNIQRQGAKARALAAKRDVNTLPDPKTYAAVSGFMGTPFQEQGWSVFHPQRQGIETAADIGYAAGLGAQLAPVAAPIVKGAAKLVGSGLNERLLSGQSLTPGFNTPAPINFAVKEPGGHFLHNRYEGVDDVDSFLKNFAGVKKDDESPLNQWIYKRYGNYMRGQMGTEMDPFVKGADAGRVFHFMDEAGKVHMPQYAEHAPYLREQAGLPMGGFAKTSRGQDMETAIDTSLSPVAVGDVSDRNLTEHMLKLRDKDPSAPVYEVLHEELDDVLKPTELRQSLRTMMKDKTLPPEYQLTEEQLKKMSLLDASEKVAQFDKYITARDEELRMRAADSVPVFKQYDDGSKWLAPEDTMEDAASREYVLQTGKHAGWCTERESNCASYGGGDSRLFILADKEGKPLVQINKEEMVPGVDIWLKYGMDPQQGQALRDEYMIHQLERMPEYQQWAKANSRVAIGEIKGRNNNMRLAGDELQKARDFVRSGTWDNVGEIENVGLTDLRDEVYKAGKATDLAPIENEAKRRFGTIYLTDDELNQIKPMLDESGGAAPFKTGGMVERNTGDNRRYL